jgi:hypothetical protein
VAAAAAAEAKPSKQLPQLTKALQQQLAAAHCKLAATQVHASAAHNHALGLEERVRRLEQQLAAAQAAAARQQPLLEQKQSQEQQKQQQQQQQNQQTSVQQQPAAEDQQGQPPSTVRTPVSFLAPAAAAEPIECLGCEAHDVDACKAEVQGLGSEAQCQKQQQQQHLTAGLGCLEAAAAAVGAAAGGSAGSSSGSSHSKVDSKRLLSAALPSEQQGHHARNTTGHQVQHTSGGSSGMRSTAGGSARKAMWPEHVPTQAKMRSFKQLVAVDAHEQQQQLKQQQQQQASKRLAEHPGVLLQPQQQQEQQARKRSLKQQEQQQQLQTAEEEDTLLALLCEEDGASLASNSSQQHLQHDEQHGMPVPTQQQQARKRKLKQQQQQQQLQAAEEEDALLALLCTEEGISLASNGSQEHHTHGGPASAAKDTGSADGAVAGEHKLGACEAAPSARVKEQVPARDAVAAVIGSVDAAGATAEATAAATAAAPSRGLGPAGLFLVKQELGALPSQQQLQYWQQADRPFDATDLQVLLQQFMMPRQVKTLAGRANRSGRARPALVDVADRVTQQYPVLAPALHGLLLQVQQEQQRLGMSSSIGAGQKTASGQTSKRKRAAPKQPSAAVYEESPAAVVLLRALRCLQLWESRIVSQPDMPTLLQRLAGVGSGSAAAGLAAGSTAGNTAAVDVEDFVDLTGGDDDAEMDDNDAAAAAEHLQSFLAGEVDVLLVREQGRVGRGAINLGAAMAVVKMEAEDSE